MGISRARDSCPQASPGAACPPASPRATCVQAGSRSPGEGGEESETNLISICVRQRRGAENLDLDLPPLLSCPSAAQPPGSQPHIPPADVLAAKARA